MTNFLIESTISLIVFLLFYHLVLEREKMHQFNRFYLLFSIVISLLIPFLSFEIIKEIEIESTQNLFTIEMHQNQIALKEKKDYTPYFLWIIYSLFSIFFLVKFVKNLLYFKKIISLNENIKYKNATLVLLEQKSVPHTFLHFIFLNKEAYFQNNIEHELYEHELTHVKQKHSYDIIFIEILKIIFWFNPIFYFYKKAIQLNHEFIADENVIKKYQNVSFYQSLLLQSNDNKTYYLASNLNYLVTKKRLIMMTKTTSKISGLIKKAGIIPLLTFMIYFLCTDIVAQEKEKSTQDYPNKELETYYENTRVIIKDNDGKIIVDKKYPELTSEQKKQVPPPPPKPNKIVISETQFKDFKNQTKYAIWIDGVQTKNSELNKYKTSDFVYFVNSYVHKNARSKNFPQENQVSLYTEKGYIEAFEKKRENFEGTIEVYKNDGINGNIKLKATNLNTIIEDSLKITSGYKYLENQTFYYIKNKDNKTEYYNRWGELVKDLNLIKKLNESNEVKLSKLKESPFSGEETKNNEFFIEGFKNPIKKENNKFYYDNSEIDILKTLNNEGFIYMNKSTFYYKKKESKITIYDRWGKVSNELSDFFNQL